MKVIQINCVYARGSTGKIVRDIHIDLLDRGVDSYVIHSISRKNETDSRIFGISNRILSILTKIFRVLSGKQFSGAHIQTNRLLKLIKKINPDVVHIHCINGNNINVYRLLTYLSKQKLYTILTLHAEFPYTGGCAHAYECEKWKSECKKCDRIRKETGALFDRTKHTWKNYVDCYKQFNSDNLLIIAVSPWLLKRVEQSPILAPFKKKCIFNGIDEKIFYRRSIDSSLILQYLPNFQNEKIVFHVTAHFNVNINDGKGGHYFLELAERLKGLPIRFLIVANTANFYELPENVTYIGAISAQEKLAALYALSDLTIITSKKETFSMPVAESLACGTPVVGFCAGGPESIGLEKFSAFVEYGNIEKLCHKVEEFLYVKKFDRDEISQAAIQKYAKRNMIKEYFNCYKKLNAGRISYL